MAKEILDKMLEMADTIEKEGSIALMPHKKTTYFDLISFNPKTKMINLIRLKGRQKPIKEPKKITIRAIVQGKKVRLLPSHQQVEGYYAVNYLDV